jgi:hypothetical protein
MRCPACDVAVGDRQRFCHECGEPLAGVTNPTEQIDTLPGLATAPPGDPDATQVLPSNLPSDTEPSDTNASADVPSHDGAVAIDATLPPTDPVPGSVTAATSSLDSVPWRTDESPVVPPESTETMPVSVAPVGFDAVGHETDSDPASTDELAAMPSGGLFDGGHEVETGESGDAAGFTLRASFVFAFLALVTLLLASVADVIDLRTSVPIDGISPGIRTLDEVGTNLAIGGYVGAGLMLLGGFAACFGLRWGAGLAGGSGLAVAGWAALTIGLFERPLFDARTTFSTVPGLPPGAVLTTTRDLGWFLLLAAGVLGGFVFLVSLRQAGTGGRRGLNPWIAALGALGSVVFAAGPLIPLGAASISSNLGFDTEPQAFFAGRLVQLGLLVLTGVLGFLSVRTYGLGLVVGGMSIAIWLWATTLVDLGTAPVGPAFLNLGSQSFSPHAVTTVGVAVAVLMVAIAMTIATVTRPRQA